jgi:hypothetical protein
MTEEDCGADTDGATLETVRAAIEREELLKCQICLEDASADPVSMTCTHQHVSCFSCMLNLYRARARTHAPVCCPSCRQGGGGFIVMSRLRRLMEAVGPARPADGDAAAGHSSAGYFACMDAMAGRFPRTFRYARTSCIVSPQQMAIYVNNLESLRVCVLEGRGTTDDILWRDANNRLLIRLSGSHGSHGSRGGQQAQAQEAQTQTETQTQRAAEAEGGGEGGAGPTLVSMTFTAETPRQTRSDQERFSEVAEVFMGVFSRLQARRRIQELAEAAASLATADRLPRRSHRYNLRHGRAGTDEASAQCFLTMLVADSAESAEFQLFMSEAAAREAAARHAERRANAVVLFAASLEALASEESAIDQVVAPLAYSMPYSDQLLRLGDSIPPTASGLLAYLLGHSVLTASHLTAFTITLARMHTEWREAAGDVHRLLGAFGEAN